MKEFLFFLVLGYVLLVIESAAGGAGTFHGIRVTGVFALIVWFGVKVPIPEGLTAVLVLGVMAEGMTALQPGLYIGAYALAYLMVRYVVSHLMYTSMLHKILLVFFVSMNGTVVLLAGGGHVDMVWPWGVLQTGLNGISALLFLALFDWLYGTVFSQEDRGDPGTDHAHYRPKGNI